MYINYDTIDSLISNLREFKERLNTELKVCNDTNNRKSGNRISEVLSEIENGISLLSIIRNKLPNGNLSLNDNRLINHLNKMVNQNYASVSSRTKARYIVNEVTTNQNSNFEHPYKSNAKRPQYDGISGSTSTDSFIQQYEKSEHRTVVEKKEIKNNHDQEVRCSDYFQQTEEKKKPVSQNPIKPVSKKSTETISKESVVPIIKSSEASIIHRKFAIYPDTPSGFLDTNLSEEQGDNYVYELHFYSNTEATFSIAKNASAMQKAISNSSFILKHACQYLNSITSGNNISTVNKGRVKKSGGVWKIIQKADIKFI